MFAISPTRPLKIAFVVNPWAGVGGPAGLRGSDGEDIRRQALSLGSHPRAGERAARFLAALQARVASIEWMSWGGAMGESVLREAGVVPWVAGQPSAEPSSAADTRRAVAQLAAGNPDLLIFVGGDGTARDVCAALDSHLPALGIPAGVKMYSGVFAVSPEAAAEIVARIVEGRAVALAVADVRDIDEDAFRSDRVVSRYYGELLVPGVGGCLQAIKCGSPPDDEIARMEIAEGLLARLPPGCLCLVGTGSTPKAVLSAQGLAGSLLGVDACREGKLIGRDLDPSGLMHLLRANAGAPVCLVLTATGGQGFLLGRGNQQLTPAVIRQVGLENLICVATPAKIASLQGRPLGVDSGDRALDHALSGWRPVWTGFEERILYRVEAADRLSADQ